MFIVKIAHWWSTMLRILSQLLYMLCWIKLQWFTQYVLLHLVMRNTIECLLLNIQAVAQYYHPFIAAAHSCLGSLSLCGISRSTVLHTRRQMTHTFYNEVMYIYDEHTCHLVDSYVLHILVSNSHSAPWSVTQTVKEECQRRPISCCMPRWQLALEAASDHWVQPCHVAAWWSSQVSGYWSGDIRVVCHTTQQPTCCCWGETTVTYIANLLFV